MLISAPPYGRALTATALMLGLVAGAAAVAAVGLPPAHAIDIEPEMLAYTVGSEGRGGVGGAVALAFGPGGIMAVADGGWGDRVAVFNSDGTFAYDFRSAEWGARHERDEPKGIDFGPGGIMAVAVSGNNNDRVQVFHANGTLSFEFGSRGDGPGEFNRAADVAFGPGGIMAAADRNNDRVQVFHANGTYAFEFGFAGRDPSDSSWPSGIAFGPGGIMAVADGGAGRVQVFHPNGTYAFQLGSRGDGPGEFRSPYGVDFGPGGMIAVADRDNNRVQVFHPNGMFAYQIGSGRVPAYDPHHITALPDDLAQPRDVAFGPGGIIAVASRHGGYGDRSYRVEVFNPPPPVAPPAMSLGGQSFTGVAPLVAPSGGQSFTGVALAFEFGSYGSAPGHLMAPSNVAFGPGGLMAVADTGNHRVQVFNPDGTFAFAFGQRGEGQGEFHWPEGVAFGPGGLLAVADMGSNRVQVFRLQ